MSEGTVRYHLNYLKKRNLVIEKKDGGYLRFFANDSVGNGDKELMAILRNKVQRYIIFDMMFNVAGSCTKLSQELELTTEVIRYHLQKLLDAGIIKKAKVENGYVHHVQGDVRAKEYMVNTSEVIFVLTNYDRINDFLITNENWFQDDITKDLIKFSIYLENKKKHRKKLGIFEKEIDEVVKTFLEIFPMPYQF